LRWNIECMLFSAAIAVEFLIIEFINRSGMSSTGYTWYDTVHSEIRYDYEYMSHIEIMTMLHQQALQQEHGERAPRTADELSKVCNYTSRTCNFCNVCVVFPVVWWFRGGKGN